MVKRYSILGLTVITTCLVILASRGARAGTLLDLVSTPVQTNTPYSLSLTPTTASTTITFEGFQVHGSEDAEHIDFFLNGTSTNLLGGSWNYTQAGTSSASGTFYDGTAVPGLYFDEGVAGDDDAYSQTITVTPGASYTLDFLYANVNESANAFIVTATNIAAVPEPATWALMLIGLPGLAAVIRTRPVRPTQL
jgi:hypothetical protein